MPTHIQGQIVLQIAKMVGVGLSGFYVQFFYGLIIILSLLEHRWNQIRYR